MLARKKRFIIFFILAIAAQFQLVANGFIAGTKVKTETGYKAIEDLKINDKVVCYDFKIMYMGPEHNKVPVAYSYTISPVINISKKRVSKYFKVTVNGESFYTTISQKFYLPNSCQWEKLKNIKVSNNVLLTDQLNKLDINSVELIKQEADFYDITVEKYHNFCIYPFDIVVHNEAITIGIVIAFGSGGVEVVTAYVAGTVLGLGLLGLKKKFGRNSGESGLFVASQNQPVFQSIQHNDNCYKNLSDFSHFPVSNGQYVTYIDPNEQYVEYEAVSEKKPEPIENQPKSVVLNSSKSDTIEYTSSIRIISSDLDKIGLDNMPSVLLNSGQENSSDILNSEQKNQSDNLKKVLQDIRPQLLLPAPEPEDPKKPDDDKNKQQFNDDKNKQKDNLEVVGLSPLGKAAVGTAVIAASHVLHHALPPDDSITNCLRAKIRADQAMQKEAEKRANEIFQNNGACESGDSFKPAKKAKPAIVTASDVPDFEINSVTDKFSDNVNNWIKKNKFNHNSLKKLIKQFRHYGVDPKFEKDIIAQIAQANHELAALRPDLDYELRFDFLHMLNEDGNSGLHTEFLVGKMHGRDLKIIPIQQLPGGAYHADVILDGNQLDDRTFFPKIMNFQDIKNQMFDVIKNIDFNNPTMTASRDAIAQVDTNSSGLKTSLYIDSVIKTNNNGQKFRKIRTYTPVKEERK